MNDEENQTNPRELLPFVIVFLVLNVVFSLFNDRIGGVFAAIGIAHRPAEAVDDVPMQPGNKGQKASKKKTAKAKAAKPKPKKPKVYPKANFPKTAPAKVALVADATVVGKPLPKLRKFSGEGWEVEDTDVVYTTDGSSLFVNITCHDQQPDKIVDDNGPGKAWKDDGVELFFVGSMDAEKYFQLCISASGNYDFWQLQLRKKKKGMKKIQWNPPEQDIKVTRFDKGYRVQAALSLDLLEIGSLQAGDSFHGQVVRNYRGQGFSGSVLLHLFPVQIYADTGTGSNHDYRAFQKFTVAKDAAATEMKPAADNQQPPPGN